MPMIARREVLTAFLVAVVPLGASAQAWVSPKGETSVGAVYQFSDFLGHVDNSGTRMAENGSQAHALSLQLDYSPTERLAIGAVLPYTVTRLGSNYNFRVNHTGVDDGRYHGTWQDYRFDVRYNLRSAPLVVTPFLALVVPSHRYATIGEVAPGRDLRETHAGVNLGRLLDPLLPRAYVDAHLGYVFSEKALGISTNKTIADASAGYFVTPRVSTRLIASYQRTLGGVTSDDLQSGRTSFPVLVGHDRLLKDTHLRAGVGLEYAFTSTLAMSGTYIRLMNGRNTHYGHGISLGVSRAFPARP